MATYANQKNKHNKYYVALGRVMSRLRDASGLRASDVAEIIGVSQPYLRIIESGHGCISQVHVLSLLTSRFGSRINYVSFVTVLSAFDTLFSRPEIEESDCLEQLICAVPGLQPLQNFGDDKEENSRIIYELITNPLVYNVKDFVDSVADSVADAVGEKIKDIIFNQAKSYLETNPQ